MDPAVIVLLVFERSRVVPVVVPTFDGNSLLRLKALTFAVKAPTADKSTVAVLPPSVWLLSHNPKLTSAAVLVNAKVPPPLTVSPMVWLFAAAVPTVTGPLTFRLFPVPMVTTFAVVELLITDNELTVW